MIIRYPGAKTRMYKTISGELWRLLRNNPGYEFREPFIGSGAIGMKMILEDKNHLIKKFWINDLDIGVASIWTAAYRGPDELIKKLRAFKPTVPLFDKSKAFLVSIPDRNDYSEIAFHKIVAHQCSFSGLGELGGPIGGKNQESHKKWKVDCRWGVDFMDRQLRKLHHKLSTIEVRCTSVDFTEVISQDGNAVLYLDPPYIEQGNVLYKCGFTQADHIRLFALLRRTKHPWLLSYDEKAKELYNKFHIKFLHNITYSINTIRAKNEILISNKPFA